MKTQQTCDPQSFPTHLSAVVFCGHVVAHVYVVCWLFVSTQHDCPLVQLVLPQGIVLGFPTSFNAASLGGEPSFVVDPSLVDPSLLVVASLPVPESPFPASPSVESVPPHAANTKMEASAQE